MTMFYVPDTLPRTCHLILSEVSQEDLTFWNRTELFFWASELSTDSHNLLLTVRDFIVCLLCTYGRPSKCTNTTWSQAPMYAQYTGADEYKIKETLTTHIATRDRQLYYCIYYSKQQQRVYTVITIKYSLSSLSFMYRFPNAKCA